MIGSSNFWCSIEGPFKCYLAQIGVGGVKFSGEKRYEGVVCNVISITQCSAQVFKRAGCHLKRAL